MCFIETASPASIVLAILCVASRLVITKGKKKGQHPSPATVLRMLREHDEAAAAAVTAAAGD